MQAQLEQDDYADVKDFELTWSQALRREGRMEGLRLAFSDLCEVFNVRAVVSRASSWLRRVGSSSNAVRLTFPAVAGAAKAACL